MDNNSLLNMNISHITGVNNKSLITNNNTLYPNYKDKNFFDITTLNNINNIPQSNILMLIFR